MASSPVLDTQEAERRNSGTRTRYWVPPRRCPESGEVKMLYHITSSGEEIKLAEHMVRGAGGIVGPGMYFADTAVACKAKAKSKGWLIKARVFLGKSKAMSTAEAQKYTFTELQTEGYDSLVLSGLSSGVEYIVYNKDQVELVSITAEP
mmetsp:Transcript_15431/g.34010  ORF Transcript_15431/g.34010 Transcript_15431/m.34010 type:complete len:149 (+) Transcript_15431:49-495(+)